MSETDPFLEEAERRGLVTAAQSAHCRRILDAMREVDVGLTIEEIAARKGFVTPPQAAEIRRALARLRVGRYEVIERLGQGAAGVVWKARDTKLDRIVALKVLSEKADVSSTFREQFLREARIAVTLNHVNIVRGLDQGEADGYRYFAMEFVDGENAETRLMRLGRIPEREAAAMALDVVHALEYVQRFHIVHRDIKPSNLLLTSTGHVKLCDLGLAKPVLTESELLGDGSTAGTPLYMSPEQIKEPDTIDWKSDVYSLGASLYHMLTGVPPFSPDSRAGILQKHLREKPKNPRDHALELSDGVASVVLRMLQKAPADRYDSLAELASDLESVLAGRPPLHTVPPPAPDTVTAERHARIAVARRMTEKHLPRERFPLQALVVFLMFVGAVIAIGMSLYGAPPPRPIDTESGGPTAPPVTPPRPPDPPPVKPPDPGPEVPQIHVPSGPDPAKTRRDAYEALQVSVTQLIEDGQFTKAIGSLRTFEASYAGTDEARRAAKEVANADMKASGRFEEMVKRADGLADRHRFDDARATIEEASKIDIAWAPERAQAMRGALEAKIRLYESERERQAPVFADLYGRAVLAAGRESVAAAQAIVDREAPGIPSYDDDASALRDDLALLAKRGTDPSVFDDHTPDGALGLLLAELAHGDVMGAERTIDAIRATGGDVDDARARVARVRGVVAQSVTELLSRAEGARNLQKLDEALRLANEAHDLLEDHLPTRVMLGRIRFEQGDFDAALRWLEPAARVRNPPPESHYWLAQVLRARNEDLLRAEQEFAQFLADAPDADPLRVEAESSLRAVHSARVDADVKQWRAVAKTARSRGEKAKAEGAWGRVAELQPDDAEALIALAQIYSEKKQQTPALVALTRAARSPTATDAEKRRAAELLVPLKGSGTYADGLEIARDAERSYVREDWAGAVRYFQAALAVSPYLDEARVKLIRSLLAQARESKSMDAARQALDVCDSLLRIHPDEPLAPALRAQANLRLGDVKRAREDADLAVRFDKEKKCPAAFLALGHAQLASGEVTGALASFQTAYQIEASPEALLGLARGHLKRGDAVSAKDVLDTFRATFGSPPSLRDEYDEILKDVTKR